MTGSLGQVLLMQIARLGAVLPPAWRTRLQTSSAGMWIARSIRALGGSGAVAVVELGGPLRGMRMQVNLQMQKAYMYGTYEPAVMSFLMGTVKDGWTVLDVGANVGYMTLVLSRLTPSGRVISFEPLPECHQSLVYNVTLNGLSNVRCECLALGDAPGARTLVHRSESLTAGGSVVTDQPTGIGRSVVRTRVAVLTGDEYLLRHGIEQVDLLKIDVEGAEEQVIRGLAGTLAESSPLIVLELHGFQRGSTSNVISVLGEFGYTTEALDPLHVVARHAGS